MLPTGLSLHANGTFWGVPTAIGTFTFTIKATQLAISGTRTYTVIIHPDPSVSYPTVTAWTVNKPGFQSTLTISGGTPGVGILGKPTGLPPGLTAILTGNIIKLIGTPTVAGNYNACTIVVQDAAGVRWTEHFDIVINPPISFTLASLAGFVVGQAYSQTVATTGGTGPVKLYAYFSAALPAGLTISVSPSDNYFTIAGIPESVSDLTITVYAVDAIGDVTAITYTLTGTGVTLSRNRRGAN